MNLRKNFKSYRPSKIVMFSPINKELRKAFFYEEKDNEKDLDEEVEIEFVLDSDVDEENTEVEEVTIEVEKVTSTCTLSDENEDYEKLGEDEDMEEELEPIEEEQLEDVVIIKLKRITKESLKDILC